MVDATPMFGQPLLFGMPSTNPEMNEHYLRQAHIHAHSNPCPQSYAQVACWQQVVNEAQARASQQAPAAWPPQWPPGAPSSAVPSAPPGGAMPQGACVAPAPGHAMAGAQPQNSAMPVPPIGPNVGSAVHQFVVTSALSLLLPLLVCELVAAKDKMDLSASRGGGALYKPASLCNLYSRPTRRLL